MDHQPSRHSASLWRSAIPHTTEAVLACQGGYTMPHQLHPVELYANISRPTLTTRTSIPPICRWDECNTVLDDTTPPGVKRHLYAHHNLSRVDCTRGGRGYCRWQVNDGICGRPLDMKSYAKHIASVHLKSTAKICEDCHTIIGRADSLTRHQRDHCSARRGWEGWI